MQIIILSGICIECVILLYLALIKKLTKRAFAVISSITLVCCFVGLILNISGNKAEKQIDEKEYVYMAARLIGDGYSRESLYALDQIQDKESDTYGVRTLRGLAYNQIGAYTTSTECLEGEENEYAVEIWQLSRMKKLADENLCAAVVGNIIDILAFEAEETDRLDAEMKLRFLSEYQTAAAEAIEQVQDKDTWIQARKAILDRDYKASYDIMSDSAKNGNLKDVIIVSNMYVKNYNERTLSENDLEYDRLWKDITDAQAQMNLMDMEKHGDEAKAEEEVTASDKGYERASAEYAIASDELFRESVKRAINYLEANCPQNEQDNIAYQLQLARLYYQADERSEAENCLKNVFAVEEIDTMQWMGFNVHLLRESYLRTISDVGSEEFDHLFENMMSALYQGLFPAENDIGFREFCKECLDNIFKGIRIGKISRENYPQITLEVSTLNQELVLTDTNMSVTDTEKEIGNITVEEKEQSILSVCFVLDRSGSMQGKSLRDAKNAIKDSVLSMGDDSYAGLVSFDNTSRIDCGLTDSKYAISGAVENIFDEGGTNIAAGLRDGLEVLKSAPGEKVILLLSDGYDSGYEGIEDVLTQLQINRITVFSIGLEGCDEAYLSGIANATGGEYISVLDTTRLQRVYEQIQQSLSNVYYVTYQVETQEEERDVKIRLKDSFIQASRQYTKTEEVLQLQEEDINGTQKSDYFKQIGGMGGGQ